MGGFFNIFRTQTSQQGIRKLLHSLKCLYTGIFRQIVFKVNFARQSKMGIRDVMSPTGFNLFNFYAVFNERLAKQ